MVCHLPYVFAAQDGACTYGHQASFWIAAGNREVRRFEAHAGTLEDATANPWDNQTIVLRADAVDKAVYPKAASYVDPVVAAHDDEAAHQDPLDYYGWSVMTTRTNATSQVYWAWAHRFWKCKVSTCFNRIHSVQPVTGGI